MNVITEGKEYHEERFSRAGGTFHMAQLWVNLPATHKMAPPRYQPILAGQMGIVDLPEGAGVVRVIAGEYRGARGPAMTFSPVQLYDVRLSEGGRLDLPFPARQNVAVLVLEGEIGVNDTTAREDDFVLFGNAGDRIILEAHTASQVLVLGGEPIDEPVVQYGPFVMNTEREIAQAIHDFNRGKFGHLDD